MKRATLIGILVITFCLIASGCRNVTDNSKHSTNAVMNIQTNDNFDSVVNNNIHVKNQDNNSNDTKESAKVSTDKQEQPQANTGGQRTSVNNAKSDTAEQSNYVPSMYTGYNKRLSWSLVRKKDNLPPVFTKEYTDIADKYGAIYLADTKKKNIYLTFDEGYENGYTGKILDTLKANNVKAAFFITSPYLNTNFDLVDRMVKEGHVVGNHTVHHPSLPEISDSKIEKELVDLELEFKEKTGTNMKFMRAPKGEFSERTLKISKDLGYTNVFWSFAYADWDVTQQKGADYAFKIVTENIHNGAVLLLHAVSKDNADALDSIIKDLKAKGYVFKSLNDIGK